MSRRRFLFTVNERAALLEGAAGLLAGATALLGMRRTRAAQRRAVDPVVLLSAVVVCVVAVAVVTAHLPNTQADARYERSTWRSRADNSDFERFFRFKACDMDALVTALEIPERLRFVDGGVTRTCSGEEALTLLLFRMANAATLHTLNSEFGLQRSSASRMMDALVDHLYDRWYKPQFVTDFKRWAPFFPEWAAATLAVQGEGGREGIVLFTDGHVQLIQRPANVIQQQYYCGHYRSHCLKWLATFAPNGLVVDLAGAFEGRHNDQFMLKCAEYLSRYEACMMWAVGRTFANGVRGVVSWLSGEFTTYLDAGFTLGLFSSVPFKNPPGGEIPAAQKEVNKRLSRTRIANEWIFGRVNSLWPLVAAKAFMQLGTGRAGKLYVVAVLLTNAHTCLYGNQANAYFGTRPPSLAEYFGGAPKHSDCPPAWFEVAHKYD